VTYMIMLKMMTTVEMVEKLVI